MEKSQITPREEHFSIEEAEHETASTSPQAVFGVGFGAKPQTRFRARFPWLKSKKFWLLLLGGVGAVVAFCWFVQPVRFILLNAAGVKAGIIISVRDAENGNTVEDAEVMVDGRHFDYFTQKDRSGQNASVVIKDLKFGKHTFSVQKEGYSTKETTMNVVRFASRTTEGEAPTVVNVTPEGLAVKVRVNHWLSGKPLQNMRVTYASVSATTGFDGKATLVIPPTGQKEIDVEVAGDGFIAKKIKARVGEGEAEVALTENAKHYYVAKQNNRLNIYSSNLDGSEVKELIPGTGKETESTATLFEINANNKRAIFVSTRDGVRNAGGTLLEQLYAVDLEKGSMVKIDESPLMGDVRWVDDDTFLYVRDINDANTNLFKQREILTYNTFSREKKTIAQVQGYNGLAVTSGKIFIAPTSVVEGTSLKNNQNGLFSITADERQKLTIENKPVAEFAHTAWQTITYRTGADEWHEFDVKSSNKKDLTGVPAKRSNAIFSVNSNESQVAWLEKRDGQNALLIKATADGATEKVVYRAEGVGQPVRWITDRMLIFRMNKTGKENANYVISLDGGEARKITNTASIGASN